VASGVALMGLLGSFSAALLLIFDRDGAIALAAVAGSLR
jgi:hypothetical protein